MTLVGIYACTVVALAAVSLCLGAFVLRARSHQAFKLGELATLSALICLMYVSVMPWKIGLAKVPGLDALIFSIPYTTVFLLGLRLVPKPGTALLLIAGQGLLGQLVGTGLNPLWWPYYLWSALVVEAWLAISCDYARSTRSALVIGLARGLTAYSYMYFLLAPLAWKQFYALWYIALKGGLGLVGCAIGALVAVRLAPGIEKATHVVG